MIELILLVICILLLLVLSVNKDIIGIRYAGYKGEKEAEKRIKSILRKGDYLLSNIHIKSKNSRIEIDEIVINSNGIFFFEVKNYSGQIYGYMNQKEWDKYTVSKGGYTYEKKVKNPVPQFQREKMFFIKFLKANRITDKVTGYVYMLNANAPAYSEHILNYQKQIDFVIHRKSSQNLDKKKIRKIVNVLRKENFRRTLRPAKVYKCRHK